MAKVFELRRGVQGGWRRFFDSMRYPPRDRLGSSASSPGMQRDPVVGRQGGGQAGVVLCAGTGRIRIHFFCRAKADRYHSCGGSLNPKRLSQFSTSLGGIRSSLS
jgi:hypothetical protein